MPSMLRKFGKIVSELRTASRELRNQLEVEMDDLPTPSSIMRDVGREIKDDLLSPYNDVIRDASEFKRDVKETLESPPEDDQGEESTEIPAEISTNKKVTP